MLFVLAYLPIVVVLLLGALCFAVGWKRVFLTSSLGVIAGSLLVAGGLKRDAAHLWAERSEASYDVNAALTHAIGDKWTLSAVIAAPLVLVIFLAVRKRAALIGAR
jgi:hypothetical protein